ncbi:MAG TPA: molybdopterin synthase sulfur carrier subunit [Cytophagales bacterium]|jgi:molybdopterin converting factor subunit 1|nr:molybdopterin synthase sulfur carrier subunit [Cytophagales bacterium]
MTERKLKLKAFGIAREILGSREVEIISSAQRVGDLRDGLLKAYPKLQGLKSFMIAVNQAYAAEDILITETDEIALIPPVSGG